MPIELLKSLRFITPGIIIILFWAFLGSVTGDWKIVVPKSISDFGSHLPAIVAAVVYYLTPLRDWANRKHFDSINQNIRRRMVSIGGGNLESPRSEWPKLRRLFYKIVDSDGSLKLHAKRAYFNGYIWTTIADTKAIAIFFATYALLHHFLFSSQSALIGLAIFAFLAIICWPIGEIVTRKHKEIGDEQLAIIEQFHRCQVLKYFLEDG
ncbi:hypothetical protein Q0601_22950 [Paracoccus onubensis]|uniref:hypothetical protein n=1 Tax=Paracoccus onubensis TaxID=1675788 RepID=UPI00273171EA|nr:hypothetical protein [Paracoccus onubensis]MDP0930047.1 hypothetical protein [Paracoccus onubensis]